MSEIKVNNTVTRIEALKRVEAYRQTGKLLRKAAANKARGVTRLTAEQRADRYREQNGTRTLTPRQKARLAKKEGHATANPLGVKA